MFDLDVSKMLIVGIVALAVISPKDLPRVMRTIGQTIGKVRRMATEFQGQFMEALREVEREADLDSVKKEFQAINDQAKINSSFDPVAMMRDDMTKAVEAKPEAAGPPAPEGAPALDQPQTSEAAGIGQSEVSLAQVSLADPAPGEPAPLVEAAKTPEPETSPAAEPETPPAAEPETPPARQSAAE